jgi:hypothetical protein
MPAYPLDLWTPPCMRTWNCGKFLRDGFHVAEAFSVCFHTTFGLLLYPRTHIFHVHNAINCWWISTGFMPRKWRNRIITRCSSNVNVAIFSLQNTTVAPTGRTVLPLGVTQPKEQPRHLQQLSRFYLLLFPRKKLGDFRLWTHHVLSSCRWLSPATLTEVFLYFFLSSKANARV